MYVSEGAVWTGVRRGFDISNVRPAFGPEFGHLIQPSLTTAPRWIYGSA